uniref:Uncharacterized protein n=1 Tax=Nelumbo nucifera TaxID=4432 RepID=A0A822Z3Z1_NELNU|nr:TPA_asm: hypothetical protein HUJ06_013840 [Nelumbo nucifera]
MRRACFFLVCLGYNSWCERRPPKRTLNEEEASNLNSEN